MLSNELERTIDTVEGNSNETGPLSNLNIAIKDNICTKQYKTTCSSAFLQGIGIYLPVVAIYFAQRKTKNSVLRMTPRL